MKAIKYSIFALVAFMGLTACTDLDEKVFDRVDASKFYQDENSIKQAVAAVYYQVPVCYAETFYFLQELSADQVAWRTWNGGLWGYDDGEKYVISTQTWNSEAVMLDKSWKSAWTIIGLANQVISDMQQMNPGTIHMTQEKINSYIAEVRMLRAWSYYSLFEIWGGSLPLYTQVGSDIPGSASDNFNEGCKVIYDFINKELDETLADLPKEDGSNATRNRMNQGVNRILKARMLLNANIFVGEDHFAECETLCKQILNGDYGTYALADDYREIYDLDNVKCPEVVFALSCEDGHGATNASCNVRNMTFLHNDDYIKYFNIEKKFDGINGWNCTCLTPSFDNAGDVQPLGGTVGATCFLDAPYNDKLGAVYERFDDRDIRKTNYLYNVWTKERTGMFLKGIIRESFGTGATYKADADRQDQDLCYVDQVGTFLNKGRNLETVMSPRWGETNSGIRLVKYAMYPTTEAGGFKDIDEVEFRLAEVYYMIAECEMRKGNATEAKNYVDAVRKRYYTSVDRTAALSVPGPGFTQFDMDWMLSEWGKEYLSEGRRRRTDLRRFDKFTQGQWWFFGRATDSGVELPAKRDRKYEWYPLPESALTVNPGLKQNPAYVAK